MTTLLLRDNETGEIIEIDTGVPSFSMSLADDSTGHSVLVDYTSPSGIFGIVDANTGEIATVDLSNPTGVIYVRDENTGELVSVDLSSPTGSIYIKNWNTGKPELIDLSTTLVISDRLIIPLIGSQMIYDQNFESLNLGDLNGQDSWTREFGTDQYVVTADDSPYTGVNCIKSAVTGTPRYGRPITEVVSGTFSYSLRANNTNGQMTVRISSGTNYYYVQFKSGGQVVIWDDDIGDEVVFSSWSGETAHWYRVDIQFSAVTHQYRARVDGGEWSSWCGTNTKIAYFNGISIIFATPVTAYTCWLDDIYISGIPL